MDEFSEKRDFLRMPIDCELSFTVSGSDRSHEGNVINLSNKGILFTTPAKLLVGDQLEILLTPSNSATAPMHASSEVMRVTDLEKVFEVACSVTDMREA